MKVLVRAEVEVAAPASVVWDYVSDWERQEEWIPFTRVEPVDPVERTRAVGGRIRAWTGIGPVGFWDTMTVTLWEEHPEGSASCEVLHTGAVVRGEGAFSVVARGADACTFLWWEHLSVPGGRLAGVLWTVVGPIANRAVTLALAKMARRIEATSPLSAR